MGKREFCELFNTTCCQTFHWNFGTTPGTPKGSHPNPVWGPSSPTFRVLARKKCTVSFGVECSFMMKSYELKDWTEL